MMLAAERAELLELQPFRRGLLILHPGVILALTLGALKCDIFASHKTLNLFFSLRHCAGGALAAPPGAIS
jgi:hypothetical protein